MTMMISCSSGDLMWDLMLTSSQSGIN